MIFYESERDNSNSGEIAEQIRTRRIKGKYYKSMRQMFLGQCTVKLNILLAHNVEELFNKWFHKLLTIDRKALQLLGYNLTDENVLDDIKLDFDRMKDVMRTNEEIDDMFRNHGDDYITGFYLRKYELISTDAIEPIDLVTSRKKEHANNIYMCYYYINTELDLSQNTFK